MPYTMPKSKVNRFLRCNKCGWIIPSDEEEGIRHVVKKHGVERGIARNISRLYFLNEVQPSEMTINEIETLILEYELEYPSAIEILDKELERRLNKCTGKMGEGIDE